MSSTEMPPAADTFIVSLPPGWAEVPLVPGEIIETMRARAAAVRGADDKEDDSIEYRRALLLLRRLAEHAEQAGVVFMATSVEQVPVPDDPSEDAAPYFLTAMAYLMTKRASALGAERLEFSQLQAAVDPEPTEAGVSRLERPHVVDLTAGPAVRDVTVQRMEVGASEVVEVLSCRYHLLIGEGEGMAVLGFQSPNVELTAELLELFETIGMTLEFVPA